ncbi:Endoribonuclease L-PSP/chorismate mutase-like protein [Umbelopsis sp. PMI_123]|nr:Endoribonuclease L-PSP/chorismate mutase-like protein [Umbelopsis sp. PMI_123]
MSGVKEAVFSKKTAPLRGPYSQAIKYNGLIFCSGTTPLTPEGKLVGVEEKDVQAQTHQVLKNISSLLDDCGSSMAKVLKVNIFIKDMNDRNVINEIYATYFPDPKPCRTCVEVARLPMDILVEIEVTAAQ